MEELKTKNESLQNEINVNLQKQLNETREQFQKQINDSVKQSVRNFQMKILLKIFDLD
jgi:FtsZ-binding cell division protein ZapB